MKKFKKICVLILSGLIFMVSFEGCEKLVQNDTIEKEFENPFEYVGEIHNEGLRFVMENCPKFNKAAISIEDINNLSISFLTLKHSNIFKIKDIQKFKELESILLQELQNKNKSIDTCTIFKNGSQANFYYMELMNIYDNISFEDTVSSFRSINKIERRIWKSKLSEREKTELLVMSSVGRHSFSFWKQDLSNRPDFGLAKSEDWRAVALDLLEADMVGGLLGFIGGACIGAIGGTLIMPGVGTLTAAVLEGVQAAVWGAILSSAWELFYTYALPNICNSEIEEYLNFVRDERVEI